MRTLFALLLTLSLSAAFSPPAQAHCQIPCGIYDDQLRVFMIEEHIDTLEKSMKRIDALGDQDDPDYNQLVRWTTNKDDHAAQLVEIVTAYFMSQRLSPADYDDKAARQDYLRQLRTLHQMMVSAMKARQTTDLTHIQDLRKQLSTFEKAYFGEVLERPGHSH